MAPQAAEDEAKGLDDVTGEQREVALRLRRLINALHMKQDSFAEATGTLRRTEVNVAWNGGQLATSRRWIEGVAKAAGVDFRDADNYLRGRIGVLELLQQKGKAPSAPSTSTGAEDLSPNAAEAMKAFDWTGVSGDEYDRVHVALAAQHPGDKLDRFASWWTAEIKRLLGERRPTAKSVPDAQHDLSPDERDAKELRDHKAAARTKKTGAKKKS